MAYNEIATKNLDIYTDILKMKKRSQIVYDTDNFIILSPAIQSRPELSRFDVLIGNMGLILATNKSGVLAIRYFDEILVLDIKEFKKGLIDEHALIYGSKSPKWEYEVRDPDGQYEVKLVKSKVARKLRSFTREEFISYIQDRLEMLQEEIVPELYNGNICNHIHSYLTAKGFLYSEENIANLYLSLRSKPFVIISGISGTGKTKIVQLFAEAVGATEENGQFKLISVRPDWSDSSDLLGYKNLQEQFVEGQLTEMVKRAHDRPQLPHFVVLDEMNLARVEYYLSEFLSIMESRRVEDGQVVSSTLVTTDEGEFSLPNNLYIIGTVNMDETTHPFSKKVLDRANTIEFNEIHLNNFGIFEQETEEVASVWAGNEHFESKYLYLKEAYSKNKELVQRISGQLGEMNEQLQAIYAQVGYRVRDEICFYMLYNEEMKLLPEREAFDFCIMQKILPRISGAETHVENLLGNLYKQFAGEAYEREKAVPVAARYPRSAQKTAEMLRRLHQNGFTSFWIS